MRDLPVDFVTETRRQHGEFRILKLWEIVLDVTEVQTTVVRLVRHQEPIEFDGLTYYPFPIASTPEQELSDGSLPSIEIAISNLSRELAKYITPDIAGNTVTMKKVCMVSLADPTACVTSTFEISDVAVDAAQIVIDLRARDFFQATIPQEVFGAVRCSAVYKDPDTCAYIGDLATCDYTLAGINGCRVHGDDEVANGRPRMHPLLFRAEPALGVREF